MKFLLDANAVIALLKGHETFLIHLRRYRPQDFGIPAIVAHELYFGAYKSSHVDSNLARLDCLQFETVSLDQADAREAGRVRAQLVAMGRPIRPYDILIAGQALARKLILVTRNVREFQRVHGLQIEDWETT